MGRPIYQAYIEATKQATETYKGKRITSQDYKDGTVVTTCTSITEAQGDRDIIKRLVNKREDPIGWTIKTFRIIKEIGQTVE